MRKHIAIINVVAVLGLMAMVQAANRGTATLTLDGKSIKIDYGRPALAGRDVMKMAPNGTVWRMGMDAATELNTAATLKFKDLFSSLTVQGNLTVKPGKYTLFAKKVSDTDWRLIVNKKTAIWGTDYNASQDVGSTPLTVTNSPSPVETFTIALTGSGKAGTLEMTWGNRKLAANFTVE